MAQNYKQPVAPTKKHLARLEREQMQSRYILIVTGIVALLVVGLILYGVLDQSVLRARQPVAVVNGENITTKAFEAQVRYGRYTLVNNALNTYQFMQLFGSDVSAQSSFLGQLQQIQYQLEPAAIGQTILDQMIDNTLVKQEADKRGITVSEDEIQKAFQEAFGYFPNGTPTPTATVEPMPTSTLTALQMTLVPPTATPVLTATETITSSEEITSSETVTSSETLTDSVEASATEVTGEITATESLTPTATPSPEPTATPYTEEGYRKTYQETIDNFKSQYNIEEADLRYLIEMELYREKVREAILAEANLSRTQEQVWARHILVDDEQTAKDILERVNAGESFSDLAAEFSTDSSNAASGGDLGWFAKGRMVEPFETAAFDLEAGEVVSQPVKTDFGYHIIQALGHEDRPLSDDQYQTLQDQTFSDWLKKAREESQVETKDNWLERVPLDPTLPAEITQLIQNASQQAQPTAAPDLFETVSPDAAPAETAPADATEAP